MKQEIDNSLLAECFDAAMKEEILEKRLGDKVVGIFPV